MQAIPRNARPARTSGGFIPLLIVMSVIWGALIIGATLPHLQALLTPPLTLTTTQDAMFGKGWLEDVAFSPNGDTVAVASSVGVWLYDGHLAGGGRLLRGHSAPVQAVAYHPQGDMIASAGWDDTVRLWDVGTGEVIHTLRGHRSHVMSVAFSSDGAWLLSGAYDRHARLWDTATGALLVSLDDHDDALEAVAFTPDDGALVTAGRDGQLSVWTPEGVLLRRMVASDDRLLTLAFAPDGTLYTGGRAGIISVWRNDEKLAQYDIGATVRSLVWSDGQLWVGWGDDVRGVGRLNTATGELERDIALTGTPRGIALHGERLVIATDGAGLALYDRDGQALAQVEAGHSGAVNALAFSPDGAYLASGGGNIFSDDKALRVWDVAHHGLVRVMDDHDAWLRSLVYSPDGRWLAVGTVDGQVMVYEAESGAVLHNFYAHEGVVLSLAFAPDGYKLASGGADEQIHIYDMVTGATVASVERAGGPVRTLLIDFDTDFSDSAAVSDQLSAFSVPDTGGVTLLCSHGDDVEGASFNPARTLRATSTYQNDIQLTDFTHGTFIRALQGHRNWVNDTMFSPDGRVLASGSYDLTARLWDVITGDELAVLEGHTRPVTRVAFSPNGGYLATASEDGSVRLWSLAR